MARINIEDKLWTDPRFNILVRQITKELPNLTADQSQAHALGSLVLAWKAAQSYWSNPDHPEAGVPLKVWEGMGLLTSIIECDLAYVVDGEVFVRGSGDSFDWLSACRKNGQKGGRPKKSNDLERQTEPRRNQDVTKTEPKTNLDEPNRNPLTLTPTLAPAPAPAPTPAPTPDRNTDVAFGVSAVAEAPAASPRKRVKKVEVETTPGSQVWSAYVQAMEQCWNLTPPRSAKASSQAAKLVELVGLETALKLAAYYPTRRSDYYVRTGHPFGTLLTDYMAMLREVNAGIKLTKGVVKEIVSKEESENACRFDQVRKETSIGLMTDEEFAEWEREQELLLAVKQNPMLQESTDGNECDTVF